MFATLTITCLFHETLTELVVIDNLAGNSLAAALGLKKDQQMFFDEGQLRLANGSYVGLAAGEFGSR